jgi:riboflavin biosynthesis pyrimidine reductase
MIRGEGTGPHDERIDGMQLLWDDGRALDAPREITEDAAGARELAEVYALPEDRTWVRAMMNTTIDGAITGADGTSGPLRNPTDSFAFGVLRALADVVLVGAETVRVEDYRRPQGRSDLLSPSLRPAGARRPALAIMSRTGRLPESIDPAWPTYLVTDSEHGERALAASGLPESSLILAEDPAGIRRSLAALGYRGIQLEGGPSTLARFAGAGELDELCFSVTHRTVGGDASRVMRGVDAAGEWELASLTVGAHATLTRYLSGDAGSGDAAHDRS